MSKRCLVVVVRAVAEVEAEHVGAGLEQRADGLAVGAGRAERGDDLGVAMATHGRCAGSGRLPRLGGDQDGAEVVDVGQRRAGDDLSRPAPRRSRGRRCRRAAPCALDALRPGAGERVGREIAPAISSAPSMPSVSAASAYTPGSRRARPRARAGTRRCARRGPCRAPSPWSRRRRAARTAARRRADRAGRPDARCRPSPCPTSRASPSIASPRMSGVMPGVARHRGRGFERHLRRGDHNACRVAREPRIAGLGRLVLGRARDGASPRRVR